MAVKMRLTRTVNVLRLKKIQFRQIQAKMMAATILAAAILAAAILAAAILAATAPVMVAAGTVVAEVRQVAVVVVLILSSQRVHGMINPGQTILGAGVREDQTIIRQSAIDANYDAQRSLAGNIGDAIIMMIVGNDFTTFALKTLAVGGFKPVDNNAFLNQVRGVILAMSRAR